VSYEELFESVVCERCEAPATISINHFRGAVPHSSPLCERCWLIRRQEMGPEMTEGALFWGEDWPDVLAWMERMLAASTSPRLRHLTAFELARQLPHLPSPPPPAVQRLLGEFGLGAR
jgi:hypothetical protein